jgi:hypothetical protein
MATMGNAMSKDLYATLHFVVPFSIDTYVPITMDNIESDSYEVWMANEHGVEADLLRAFQSTRSRKSINEKAIRCKMDFGSRGGVFYVDRHGIVLRKKDGDRFELSEKQMLHIEQLLQGMVGIIDVKAYDRFRSDN